MAKKSALVFGIIFILVGLLGFIPGHGIVGEGATFETNGLHDIIHLIFGLILLIVALKSPHASASTVKWVGIIYIILAVIGFIQGDSILRIVPVNGADNWLHLVLGVILAAIGFAAKRDSSAPIGSSSPTSTPQM